MFQAIIVTFLLAMVPIIELRGALPVGVGMGLDPLLATAIAIIGNLVPVPFILILMPKILALMRKWEWSRKFAVWLEKKAEKNRKKIDQYGWLGLVILVAVPLPGTGAWTGALVASCLEMKKRASMVAITAGVIIAGTIVMGVTYGVASLL